LTPANFACYKPVTRQGRERRPSFQSCPIEQETQLPKPRFEARGIGRGAVIAVAEEATMLGLSQQIGETGGVTAGMTGAPDR